MSLQTLEILSISVVVCICRDQSVGGVGFLFCFVLCFAPNGYFLVWLTLAFLSHPE